MAVVLVGDAGHEVGRAQLALVLPRIHDHPHLIRFKHPLVKVARKRLALRLERPVSN